MKMCTYKTPITVNNECVWNRSYFLTCPPGGAYNLLTTYSDCVIQFFCK